MEKKIVELMMIDGKIVSIRKINKADVKSGNLIIICDYFDSEDEARRTAIKIGRVLAGAGVAERPNGGTTKKGENFEMMLVNGTVVSIRKTDEYNLLYGQVLVIFDFESEEKAKDMATKIDNVLAGAELIVTKNRK